MFDSLIQVLLGGLLTAGSQEDRIPGSSVTPQQLKEVLTKTSSIRKRLAKLSAIHADALRKLIPEALTVAPVSQGVQRLDTEAIIAALNGAKDTAATLAAQFPGRAPELSVIQTDVDQVLQMWQAIVNADFANEEVKFDLDVSISGPKARIEPLKEAVTKAVDDAIIMAVIDLRLGIAPGCGHLLILDEDGPQHIEGTSITGDALKQRVTELGGTIVSDEDVQNFIDERRKSSAVSDDAEDDWEEDEELDEDDEIELDEEEDEVGSSPLV